MKLNFAGFLIILTIISSCGEKENILTTKFDIKNFKEHIEKAYLDSTNKENRDILLSFINDNLEGKISNQSNYYIKNRLESSNNKNSSFRYIDILNDYAIPYTIFQKKYQEFSENISRSISLKLLRFYKDVWEGIETERGFEIEIENKNLVDIASIDFILYINNASGNEIYSEFFSKEEKIEKGKKRKIKVSTIQDDGVLNMDIKALFPGFDVSKITFTDGTSINKPE